jgi:hypothetical protein
LHQLILSYLLFEEREAKTDPDAGTLNYLWPAHLHLDAKIPALALSEFARADRGNNEFYLVPFARDAGDGVWFFGSDGIYFVDLGWEVWLPVKVDEPNFMEFVNVQRRAFYLQPWTRS